MPKKKESKIAIPKDWEGGTIVQISDTACVAVIPTNYRGDDGFTVQRGWKKQNAWQHGKRMFFSNTVAEELVAIINGFLGE